MKALIYNNNGKDVGKICFNKLIDKLTKENIEYVVLTDDDLNKDFVADVIFTLGGDGTLLYLNEFANKTRIPLIGINTGRLGFLSEFEKDDIEEAVDCFVSKKLYLEERLCAKVTHNNNSYIALNEACVQRLYFEGANSAISTLEVVTNGSRVLKAKGDGIIISTPTGTTAYSLSAGGPILTPNIDAFSITPIAAHSLGQRSIVTSTGFDYSVTFTRGFKMGLYVDGKYIATLSVGDSFSITKYEKPTLFLRRKSYDFFVRFHKKLKENFGEEND
jgi:NAD+ kinase